MKPIDLFRAGFWSSLPVGGKTLLFYSMNTAPYLGAIEWDDATGFGASLAAPAIPPTASNGAMAVSPNGKVLVTAGGGTVFAYKITEDGFGEKYSAPSVGISGNCYKILFNPNGQYVHLHQTDSPFLSTYEWDDITGFGAKISAPGGLSDFRGLGFSKDGGAIFIGINSGAGVVLPIRWAGTAYGAAYPGISVSSTCYGIDANPNDGTLVLGINVPPYSKTVAWSDATGAGAILPDPATPFPWYPDPLKFSPDGVHIAFHSTIAAPSLGAYEWTAGGIGARLPDPPSPPSSGDGGLAWSNSGKAVFMGGGGTPFIRAWRFSSGSFGDKYPDPAAIPAIARTVIPVTF